MHDDAEHSGAAPSTTQAPPKLGFAAWLGVLWTILPAVNGFVLLAQLDRAGTWLRGHETVGVAMYVAGFVILSGLGFLPTYASAILGGWAFGVTIGIPAALSGFLGGALIGYAIAKRASGDRVERLIASKPHWLAVRNALVGGSPMKTLSIVTLLRLPLNSPFALSNLVLASVRTPVVLYAIGTLVGMAPRTVAVVYLASTLQEYSAMDAAKQDKPKWLLYAGIAALFAAVVIVGAIANRAMKQALGGRRPGSPDVSEA